MATEVPPQRRRLGSSAIGVAPLGLGCMSFSGVYGASDDEAALGVIRHALDRGVTLLDTADMYGWGHNEELVGRAIAGRRSGVVLATKFGQEQGGGGVNGVDGRPAYGISPCEASQTR